MRTILLILAVAAFSLLTSAASAQAPATLIAQGKVDDAIEALQRRINAVPNDAEAHNLLCRAYFSLGEWDKGIPSCEQAISLDPQNGLYHLWLGRIYGEKADSVNPFSAMNLAGKVRNQFEAAAQLSPKNVDAHTDLAEFYVEAPGIVGGGTDKAEAQARLLEDLDPAKAHWVRGRLAQKKKDMATAEKEFRAAIDASKGGALAWFNLALFYRKNQQWDQMEQTIAKAVAAPLDRPEVVMESGDVLLRAGRNFSLATQLLRRYLAGNTVEEGPAFRAHYLLGSLLEKQGDSAAAAQEYRAALALAKNYSKAREALDHLSK